jgi:hypothetical protein
MKATFKILTCALLCIAATSAFAVAPAKDNITVTALPSLSGVVPTNPPLFPHNWFYVICVPSGGSLQDTLNINFANTDGNGAPGPQGTISFNAVGNPELTSGITVPDSFCMIDDGSTCPNNTTINVPISTGVLTDGTYNANLQISVVPQNGFTLSHGTIHIQVTVGGACSSPGVTCFFTDSNFQDLTDCSGAFITGNTGGRFRIVTDTRGKATATNPGQFYYNMLWSNTTGIDQVVTVNLTANNLIPSNTDSLLHPIAQAAHAYFFDTLTGFTDPYADWQFVNTQGQPCGPSGPCTITVPAGDTLFVTWHLVYSHLRQPTIGVGVGCANANAAISATGEVMGTGIDDTCTADALGYKTR